MATIKKTPATKAIAKMVNDPGTIQFKKPAQINADFKHEVPAVEVPAVDDRMAEIKARMEAVKKEKSALMAQTKEKKDRKIPAHELLRGIVERFPETKGNADKILIIAATEITGISIMTLITQYNKYKAEINK